MVYQRRRKANFARGCFEQPLCFIACGSFPQKILLHNLFGEPSDFRKILRFFLIKPQYMGFQSFQNWYKVPAFDSYQKFWGGRTLCEGSIRINSEYSWEIFIFSSKDLHFLIVREFGRKTINPIKYQSAKRHIFHPHDKFFQKMLDIFLFCRMS